MELYEGILTHYGSFIGVRHARKHLSWALDEVATTAGAPIELRKRHRAQVLTVGQPDLVRQKLAEAFDAFAAVAASRDDAIAGRMAA
jgi:hypothetical protein